MEKWDIRYSTLDDKEWLLKEVSDPDNLQWFPMLTEDEIEKSVTNWIGFSRFRGSLTATINNEICAIGTLFFMPYRKVAHQCSFYLLVSKKHRKKGIGTSMLRNLMNLAKNYFRIELLNAEVYGDCSILSLLEKNSFETIAYQKNFIKDKTRYLSRTLLELDLSEMVFHERKN